MSVALFSDIYANLPALDAMLAAARKAGASGFVILGDLVGHGGAPAETVERVMALAADGAVIVYGNHDEMDADPRADMDLAAADAALWTHAKLADRHKTFLRALPLTVRKDDRL
jgi:predicted phosphodiesterase